MIKLKRMVLALSVVMLFTLSISVLVFASNSEASDTQVLCVEYLETLSDEALLELHEPFVAVINEANARYGVEIMPFPIYEPWGRIGIINVIAGGLEEHKVMITEFAELLIGLDNWNALDYAIMNAYKAGEINIYEYSVLLGNLSSIGTYCLQELAVRREMLDNGADISQALVSIAPRISTTTSVVNQQAPPAWGNIVVAVRVEITRWTDGMTSGAFYTGRTPQMAWLASNPGNSLFSYRFSHHFLDGNRRLNVTVNGLHQQGGIANVQFEARFIAA